MPSDKLRCERQSIRLHAALSLALVLALGSCAGSVTSPETLAATPLLEEAPAKAEAAESPARALPAESSAEAPVIYRPEKPTDVFPPAPAEGLIGIVVPAIVSEPVAIYQSSPESLAMAEAIFRTLELEPERRGGPPDSTTAANPNEDSLLAPPAAANLAPALATSFESLEFDDNGANNAGSHFVPADPSGAAGPNHVMNVVNASVQIHTKAGFELLDSNPDPTITGISLASFFSELSPPVDALLFDPKVIYDQHAGRFLVVALEKQDDCPAIDGTDSSRILVAVSDDSDPSLPGTWYFTAIDSKLMLDGDETFADYPGFAVDEEAVYITTNQFPFGSGMSCTSSSSCTDDRLWVIDKFGGEGGGFYGNGPNAIVSSFDPSDSLGASAFPCNPQPAHTFGVAPTSPNVGTWLTVGLGDSLPAGSNTLLQVIRFDDPIGPGTPTFTAPKFVSLGKIDDLGGPLPDAPQSGSATLIDTGDRRALDSVWRDNNRLYVTITIDPASPNPNAGQATAHWVILDTSILTGSPPPYDIKNQGDLEGEDIATGIHTFFPSIAVNDSHDVAIGFSASSATTYPGSYYTTRKAADDIAVTSGSAVLRAGLDDYVRTLGGSSNRWGGYSAVAVDPFDECFWVYNQHAIAGGTVIAMHGPEDGRWGTAWGYFCDSCPTNLIVPSGTSISGSESRQARDSIATSTLTVGNGNTLTLTSGAVGISDGLTVGTTGSLTIVNGPCS